MAERRHVHSNLMCTAGFYLQLEQCELAIGEIDFFCDYIMRDRVTTACSPRCHARPPLHITADCTLDGALILLRPTMHQRHICFVYFAPAELACQSPVRLIVLCHYHQSASCTIQPMDDPRPQFTSHSRQRLEVVKQGIDERSAIARVLSRSCSGVNHHSSRLVDDGQVVILVDDIEGN